MEHPKEYANREVVVLGLARSGVSAARTMHAFGAVVKVNDRKPREESPEAEELEQLGIEVLCGGHPDGLIHPEVALVIKNPGIPYTASPVARAIELGIEVVTEVEVAYYLSAAPMIGITGSNGKTTTTTWIGNILTSAGSKPIVAGNIGTPLCDAALEAEPENWIVAELSSFQLKGTRDFAPRIACLLNVAETHLDYHGSMDDYTASKAKIFANQTPEDTSVVNWDDPYCRSLVPYLKGRVLPFSMTEELPLEGVYAEPPYLTDAEEPNRKIVYRDAEGAVHEIVRTAEIGIPGTYNVANAMAACAASIASGVRPEQLKQPLKEFGGVEHRLEALGEIGGITYYNNSKATNSKATLTALSAFERPVVLIAGGLDRGSDYEELSPALETKVKALVTLGETRERIAAVARRAGVADVSVIEPREDAADTLQEAVREAVRLAQAGDTVLLSPACASWDMFASFEERGRVFTEAVRLQNAQTGE
ncbi:UDP-N-acetylmuramoyl-L-alanine--D-glutamate ligase [Saccharibacillus sp. CPCC 101409]|uniref:UDP-N-acetylmuramoyl-L-alanine--D-glutamate ligase n=1 Tax=Saccharibacillus sp. CPCC 101409 TaxID=3058041 RepID=UPI0026717A7B|nr:UDP-N-acetylmuramoyl-L-alanine--D-glutamate ligase [Saccharibacillus sp. CPCC 101409]MDO3409211.1 UDP-N-acetylmuramoyl-L-alanine--D-glutamate ligase [Saccharibacillus sp. CPCC 101409]